MPDKQQQKKPEARVQRVKLTAQITLAAYDAIIKVQRRHRRRTGRHQPLWRIVDASVRAYAKRQGIEIGE